MATIGLASAATSLAVDASSAIAAHPSQTGTVFASIQNTPDVFRSTDFGQTWSKITIPTSIQVNAIAFDPNGVVIAATFNGLFISTDGGNTWTAGASPGVQANQALAIASTNPRTVYLVNSSGVQKSSDGGKTLAVVLPGVSFSHFGRIAVDPRNPSTV